MGYVAQSAVCVFLPLLFTIFNRFYNISLIKLTFLTTVNFTAQLAIDFLSMFFVSKIGYRKCAVLAHIMITVGFLTLGIFAAAAENTYAVIFGSVVLFSIGGGLLEVLINPIVESCPSDNKAASMSILHSMYAFGSIIVVLVSALFLNTFGKENWQILCLIMAAVPVINTIAFLMVPIAPIEDEERLSLSGIIKSRVFLLCSLLMFAGGAAEVSMSQWSSAFAESTLGISKALGDILGPCMFAAMLAAARVVYPIVSKKVKLRYYMVACSVLCIGVYLVAALTPYKYMALICCGLCGFLVGIFWPGTISLAVGTSGGGSVAMFALLALAGDLGCTAGPTLVGSVASAFNGDLRAGLLTATVFPVIMLIGLFLFIKMKNAVKLNKA